LTACHADGGLFTIAIARASGDLQTIGAGAGRLLAGIESAAASVASRATRGIQHIFSFKTRVFPGLGKKSSDRVECR